MKRVVIATRLQILFSERFAPRPKTAALFFAVLLLAVTSEGRAFSQIQIGTVKGTVTDSTGALLPGARVTLDNSVSGYHGQLAADDKGAFAFNNVPFDVYLLSVEAVGFEPARQVVRVRSNIPITLDVKLNASGTRASVTVESRSGLIEADSANSEIDLGENLIRASESATRRDNLQRLIATTPGWAMEDNGLLHIRGVDDGIVYVIDGIPIIGRLDALSASAFDVEMIASLNIITGNIPAEFGGRSGAVVTVQPRSGIDLPLQANISFGAGKFQAKDLAATFGGRIKKELGFFLAGSANRSSRFLDPPDPRNFNNRGGQLKLNLRADWHPAQKDILLFNLSADGSDFRVPNRVEQEIRGQRQREELRDNNQSVSYQRVWSSTTVSNIAYFRRFYESRVIGSRFDTPLFADGLRKHTHQGIIVNLTHSYRNHTIKAGAEASRVTPRERLIFAVTDLEAAEAANITEAALAFDKANPFVFSDRKTRGQVSWYAQDAFVLVENLSVSAGLRYDHSSLLIRDQQFSPRIGAVYYVAKTRTAIRASFNRLYMPPQIENLLLADSDQARRLSPFRADQSGGGQSIRPEKVSAYEAGFSQNARGLFKFDAVWWQRSFRNYDDPNVFFNTTIIFPNSVARGIARGVDARVDVPERKGLSAFLSYGNARILQTGPINGGLFLTDEFIEIKPGTKFIPDHDQRNQAALGIIYRFPGRRLRASFFGRHDSGVPLEVDEETIEELRSAAGADLVNFERGRVKPRTIFDASIGAELLKAKRANLNLKLSIENLFNRRFAFNFGNPFSGTHFGYPRLVSGQVQISIH